ncbi:MAG: tRNA lysidine(34) synthetase TilS [Kiritimatiellales bacterium]
MDLIEKVKAAIERESLIPDGATVIVGVSGGADSVALLHILHRLGYRIVAAHLNHGIRGAEADADEQFVKELCAKLGVECVTQKTDVPALAKQKGLSLEMAAREARHEFFQSKVQGLKSKVLVALGHHADDQMETFFLRAARGSGPSGLSGMRSFQCLKNLTLVRPMLGIRRSEIFQWLEKEGLEWREDASNADETIPRNIVRHQILPILGKLNGRASENILRTMEILRDEDDHPEKAARRREIRDWLIEQGVTPTFDAVEQVVEFAAQTDGSRAMDLEGLRIINEYGTLRVGTSIFPNIGNVRMEEGCGILRGPREASVSLAKVAGREVVVRTAQPGDRMEPYGMEGSKKLQDIFTDLKIPKAQRESWPVVECGGEIIWLPGYRIARGWELSAEAEPALHLFAKDSGQNY